MSIWQELGISGGTAIIVNSYYLTTDSNLSNCDFKFAQANEDMCGSE